MPTFGDMAGSTDAEDLTILAVVPTQREFDALLGVLSESGIETYERTIGRVPALECHGGNVLLAQGGLGKAQNALLTQHLIDHSEGLSLVVCAGSAGALLDTLAVGDVVVATATIEHDFKTGMSDRPLPRFQGHSGFLSALKAANRRPGESFQVKFGPIASGDETVVDADRAAQVSAATGAIAVAWEGAGAARACEFSNVPFLEIRGMSDSANELPEEFFKNIPTAMRNVAHILGQLAGFQL